LTGSQTAASLDVFPFLRNLPEFLLPIKKYGREIHQREHKLFLGHYLSTKQKLEKGTAKVRTLNWWKNPENADGGYSHAQAETLSNFKNKKGSQIVSLHI